MMKEYIVTLKATSTKTVEISAKSRDEALEMIENIYFRTDAIQFTVEDIEYIDVDAELSCGGDNYDPDECEDCIHACPECGACFLEDGGECGDLECEDCDYCCTECGACLHPEGESKVAVCDTCGKENDEEFELRKQIFNDYLENTFGEMLEYADTLFGLES